MMHHYILRAKTSRDRMLLVGIGLALLANILLWFVPNNQSCVTSPLGPSECFNMSLVDRLGAWSFLVFPIGVALGGLYSCIPYWFRTSRYVLFGWSGLILAVFVVGWGIDWVFLPSAAVVLIASVFPNSG